jgi:hypothetical protein
MVNENYEGYKKALDSTPGISELKRQAMAIVEQKQLNPQMNDTKWLELQGAIRDLPFPPPYIVKCLTDTNEMISGNFDEIPEYLGDWSGFNEEGLPPFFNIEWMKISPRYAISRGQLVKKEVLDEYPQLLSILEKNNIPFEERDGLFIIYGYK